MTEDPKNENSELPESGDPTDFEEEPSDEELSESEESGEQPEGPNDLSGVKKEFED